MKTLIIELGWVSKMFGFAQQELVAINYGDYCLFGQEEFLDKIDCHFARYSISNGQIKIVRVCECIPNGLAESGLVICLALTKAYELGEYNRAKSFALELVSAN